MKPRQGFIPALVFLVALAAALPFLGALGHGFVWDDHVLIERNPALGKPLASFGNMIAMEATRTPYYRPVSVLWWSMERALFGLDPLMFHLLNILLHAVASVLVLAIALRLFTPACALVSGLLFAVHPAHVEPVAFASAGATELLPSALFLGALWLLLPVSVKPGEAGMPGPAKSWAAACLYLLALFSKEMAVGLPLLALGIILVRNPAGSSIRQPLFRILPPLAFASLVYAGLRLWAMSRPDQPLPAAGRALSAWHAPAWLLGVFKILLFPVRLVPYYDLQPLSVAGALALLLFVGASCFGLIRLGRARGWDLGVTLGLGLLLVTLAPAAPLLPRLGALVSDRLLYLPSAGLALLAGSAAAAWSPKLARSGGLIGAGALAAAIAVLGGWSFILARDWRDDRTLFLRALARNPRNTGLQYMAAKVHLGDGDLPQAERLLRAALERTPRQREIRVTLAQSLQLQGKLEAAEAIYRALLAEQLSALDAANAWFGIGSLRMQAGAPDGGKREFEEALRLDPYMLEAHLNLGEFAFSRGDHATAARYWEAGLRLDVGNADLLNNLGALAQVRGDLALARSLFRRTLEQHPGHVLALQNLAGLPPEQ